MPQTAQILSVRVLRSQLHTICEIPQKNRCSRPCYGGSILLSGQYRTQKQAEAAAMPEEIFLRKRLFLLCFFSQKSVDIFGIMLYNSNISTGAK